MPNLRKLPDLESFKYRPERNRSSSSTTPSFDFRVAKNKAPSRLPQKQVLPADLIPDNGKLLLPSLKPGLKIVFVGFNPSIESSRLQHHYAHRSNRFWKFFNQSQILSKSTNGGQEFQCSPNDDYALLEHGIGFTDLVLRPTKSIAELPATEMLENVPRIIEELNNSSPKIVCVIGKGIWEKILSYYNAKKSLKEFQWGRQDSSINKLVNLAAEVNIFVLPSTSGLVSIPYDTQLKLWSLVSNFI